MDNFEEISQRLKEPAKRAEVMKRIDSGIQKLYNVAPDAQSVDVDIKTSLAGIQYLRYQVIMLYLTEVVGISPQEAHEFIFNQGIEHQIQKLGAIRKSIFEELDITTEQEN